MFASGAPSDGVLLGIRQNIREAVNILQMSKVKIWDNGQCEADVRRCIDNIFTTWKSPPSDPGLRKNLEAARRALGTAADLVPWCFDHIHAHIADASSYITFHVDQLKASKESGPKTKIPKTNVEVPLNTSAKYAAAWSAHYLIRRWSTKKPKETAGGPYFKLARLLYEAASGHNSDDPGQSIDRQCRKVLKEWSARDKAARN
jgi:hypothetical protein